MAGTYLQIDDDYIKNVKTYFVDEGKEIESFLKEYISILESIKKTSIIRGDVAVELGKYINYAKKMKGQINNISETANKQCIKFISSVDNADQYLF